MTTAPTPHYVGEVMDVYHIAFDGSLLQRGFWLYVWSVQTPDDERLIYVGRTGDTSSPNAQSPFRRIGQHVDPNPKSRNNALTRHLRERGVAPKHCRFAFTALGPIFGEAETMKYHIPLRDRMGALERCVADWFTNKGFSVLGSHPKRRQVDADIWRRIESELRERFAV